MSVWAFSKRYAVPLWGWYAAGFVLLAAVNLVALKIPQLAKELVNIMVESRDLSGTEQTALTIIGLGFLMLVIRAMSRILIFWPGRTLETTVKSDLFRRMMRIPQNFYESFGMGDLISRLANDVGQLRVFYAFGLLQFANMIFLIVFTVTMMMSVHVRLTVACLSPLILMIVIARIAMPRMHKYSRLNQEALGRLTNRVTEAFVNIHVIQTNTAEESFCKHAAVENDAVYDSNMKLVVVRTLLFPLMIMLAGLAQLVVLFYGGLEVMAGRLTAGDILAFNVYIGLLVFPLTAMGILLSVYQRARTALDRVNVIAEAPIETFTPAERSNPEPDWLVEVKNLTFSFPPKTGEPAKTASQTAPGMGTGPEHKTQTETQDETALEPHSGQSQGEARSGASAIGSGQSQGQMDSPASKPILKDISFTIAQGEKVGLYGPIGSGKSTLFNVMCRLYDPPRRKIYFDGYDVLHMRPRQVRQCFGYALQTVHLFSANIRDNLTFGLEREDPIQEEIEEAAAMAQILDDIEGFPNGWDTQIGEKGVRLSGGQKQRLALARLFLRKPSVLLLDDVMSAVDHSTEQKLIENIYGAGFTMLIVSHRSSVLKRCDKILMLEGGEIVDRGSFTELESRHSSFGADDQPDNSATP